MKTLFQKWFCRGNKVLWIANYKKAWKKNGNKPRLSMFSNGAKKEKR